MIDYCLVIFYFFHAATPEMSLSGRANLGVLSQNQHAILAFFVCDYISPEGWTWLTHNVYILYKLFMCSDRAGKPLLRLGGPRMPRVGLIRSWACGGVDTSG
jgi:hypothetical protein